MADQEHQLTTPVGRMIGGNLYRGKSQNDKGVPYIYKSGAKKGQPYQQFNFGVAFPKTPGATHWSQEPWLQAVWALGHAAWPQGQAGQATFSWKIIDGDSTIPNKSMKRPCDQEGYPGHWVVWYSGTAAPRVTNANGSQVIAEPDAVRPGYFVQVFCSVTKNTGETPGIYWNAHYVALSGYGQEIANGPDLSAATFGQGVQLPPGASVTPPAGMAPPAAPGAPPPPPPAAAYAPPPPPPPPPAAPAPVGLVPVPGAQYTIDGCRAAGWTDDQIIAANVATRVQAAYTPPPPPPPAPPAPLAGFVPPPPGGAPIAPVPVTPNPAFTQMAPPPPPPPAAPAPVPRQPTALATGRTRDQLLAMPGWTEALLVEHGYLS